MMVWDKSALTDEALMEMTILIRTVARSTHVAYWLVAEAKRVEQMLPPLRELAK